MITELKICLKHVPAQLPFRLDQRTGTFQANCSGFASAHIQDGQPQSICLGSEAVALSRLKQGFDSPRERQSFQYLKRKTPAHRFRFFNFSPTANFLGATCVGQKMVLRCPDYPLALKWARLE